MNEKNTAQTQKEEREKVLRRSDSLKTARRFWRTSNGTKNAGFAPAA